MLSEKIVDDIFEMLQRHCGYRIHDDNDTRGLCACDQNCRFDTTDMITCLKQTCRPLNELIDKEKYYNKECDDVN